MLARNLTSFFAFIISIVSICIGIFRYIFFKFKQNKYWQANISSLANIIIHRRCNATPLPYIVILITGESIKKFFISYGLGSLKTDEYFISNKSQFPKIGIHALLNKI
jgi:hypothetical protein